MWVGRSPCPGHSEWRARVTRTHSLPESTDERLRNPPRFGERQSSRGRAPGPPVDPVVLSTRGLSVWYGRLHSRISRSRSPKQDHGHDRSVGLRQEHIASLLQPDERLDRRIAHERRHSVRWGIDLVVRHRRRRSAAPHRNGVSETEPVPEDHLQQRRLGHGSTDTAAT